ncbi:hypothetical protein CQW23_06739 [Capsicum baccatum]|uniref:NB-ARC domain-containing protein n=1 Tax=Capsicum baccatum TaxID=33114 RepID=A0A2G2X480_CAPBA|nr:hypothetical protein CQW23_06739 [Capsicum baccatum]
MERLHTLEKINDMGGIGKSTLAKEVYNDVSVLHRFDVRAWATVSQQHDVKEILLSLLCSTIKLDDTDKIKDEAELADMLHKILNEVACYAGTENLPLKISFMDQDESWNLLKSAALTNEALPSEFETIGKQIVDKCQGLPLTIAVVVGILQRLGNCFRKCQQSLETNSFHFLFLSLFFSLYSQIRA